MDQNLKSTKAVSLPQDLPKCPSGIQGLDEITLGGLPRGRSTLVCGGAGCGKTLLGMQFLIRGATEFNEPGACISFEETADELSSNVRSLGFDVCGLIEQKKLVIDHVYMERSMLEEAGEYDLEGLFIRIAHAIDSIGAKRILIDSLEALFTGFPNEMILRAELRRLFTWLKQRGVSAVITAERGNAALTRHGLEEYISDCVILLDHRVTDTVLTRRLRVVKYRGSTHGTNEYPFLIEEDGISVLPVTSLNLSHVVSDERVTTGVAALDEMLGGQGYRRGSSILVSGTAGTGKTSLMAHLVDAACARGERCSFVSFEESANQIVRNMRSIGIDLGRWVDQGLLHFHSARPTTFGLETHLAKIHRIIRDVDPRFVIVDPVNGLLQSGTSTETRSMLLRLVDFLKEKQITALMTTLHPGAETQEEQTIVNISSLVDTWLLLRDIESAGERNRGICVLKSRGAAHSNQVRELVFTERGIELRKFYLGAEGLVTGAARFDQESRNGAAAFARQEIEQKQFLIKRKRRALEAQIASLQLQLETEEQESLQSIAHQELKIREWERDLVNASEAARNPTVLSRSRTEP